MYLDALLESKRALQALNGALALGVLLCGALFASWYSDYRKPPAPQPVTAAMSSSSEDATALRPLPYYVPLMANNVFGFSSGPLLKLPDTTRPAPVPAGISNTAAAAAPPKDVTLNLDVLGTVAWNNGFGYTVIARGNDQDVYRVGDEVGTSGTLSAVYPDHIEVLTPSGATGRADVRTLEDKSAGVIPDVSDKASGSMWENRPDPANPGFARRTGEGQFVVNRKAVESSISQPQRLLTDARLLPFTREGVQKGFSISEIRKNGIYDNLGLRNGDILLSINNFELANMEAALKAFTALRGMDRIELMVERDGKRSAMKYDIR